MKHIDDYLNRGGPVVGLRTSTHGFRFKDASSPYAKYSFRYGGEEYKNGFGHQVLGQTWVGHYGRNHHQATRITIIPEKAGHPILRGVKNVWAHCGGYNAIPADDWDCLTMAQPLTGMAPDTEADAKKPPKVSEWTRHYTSKDGKKARVFTSLYGASEDILSDGYRRLVINGIYWSVKLEAKIKPDSTIDFVGPYRPSIFSFGGYSRGNKPLDYAGFDSPIPGHAVVIEPDKTDAQKKRKKVQRPASTVESVAKYQ